jgi:hypothetical protein
VDTEEGGGAWKILGQGRDQAGRASSDRVGMEGSD